MARKFKIRKGDQVRIITGKSKGHSGEVIEVLRESEKVLVRGGNLVRRHTRPSQSDPGGIITKEAPVHISNVALLDPEETDRTTRVGYQIKDDLKLRVARRSGKTLNEPKWTKRKG